MNLTCSLMETIYCSKKGATCTLLSLSLPALDIIEVLEKMMILSKLRMKLRNTLSIIANKFQLLP